MRIRILGRYVHAPLAALAAVEAVGFGLAFLAAVALRFEEPLSAVRRQLGPPWPRAVLYSAVMLVALFAFGLYSSRQRAPLFGLAVRGAAGVLTASALITIAFYVLPDLWVGRGVLGYAAILSLLMLLVTRFIFTRVIRDNIKRTVLVYGAGERAASSISSLRRRSDRSGFTIAGYVQPHGEPAIVPQDQVLPPDRLREQCERLAIDEVVVAMDDRRRAFPVRELLECRLSGIDVTELPTFLERETGRVRIDVLNPSWMIFGDGFRRDPVRLFSARALDLVSSLLIATVSLPFIALTALAIKLEDGWSAPLLYRQERVGFGGRVFHVLKFRSMCTDAEPDGQAQWAQEGDPRVTRVGAVIRKLRIDELPQVFNVLRGDMGLVGPRPERPQFVAELSERIPYYVQRHYVKPGITGWAQLCYPYGSSEQDALEKLQYDLYYIKNHTLMFDLSILVQTVEVVLMGKGAR
ncbi:MAG: TIGR03013 family PEP-CTERM/XrtA system glycosyltransferase [Proteobacteria bacterium]|nr:TIGR03013 family PEP-CTERM/XrtA system glycosyltransferase [Pseudomonadota bacterium]